MTTSYVDQAMQALAALPLDDLVHRWGDLATDWQQADARAVLDPEHPQRLHWLGRPKGGSKTTDVAALLIVWLLSQAYPGDEGVVAAGDGDQANRLLDRARGFVRRTPALEGRIRVQASAILGPNDAKVTALTADAPTTEGILTPFAVVEELPNWKQDQNARDMWTAIFSVVPKIARMRLVVIGHAGDPAHFSHKILERARKSARWRVNDVPGPLEWVDPEELDEQRALLTESQFTRRHLNVWTSAEDRLVKPEDLAACVVLDGPQDARPGVAYCIGVDLGLRKDRTVIAVCHSEPTDDGRRRVVLDRKVMFRGTRAQEVQLADVEAAILDASRAYNGARVRLDPWQMVGLKQRLQGRGVFVEEFNFTAQSVGRLGATLYTLLRARLLALPGDDEELIDELEHVRLRESSPGVLRIDHDADRFDDQVIALALAASALVEGSLAPAVTVARPPDERLPSPPRGRGQRIDSASRSRVTGAGPSRLPRVAGRRTGREP